MRKIHLWLRVPNVNSQRTIRTYCGRQVKLPLGAIGWDRIDEVTCLDCIDARRIAPQSFLCGFYSQGREFFGSVKTFVGTAESSLPEEVRQ